MIKRYQKATSVRVFIAVCTLLFVTAFAKRTAKTTTPVVSLAAAELVSTETPNTRPRITVWVHGTRMDTLFPTWLLYFVKKDIDYVEKNDIGLVAVGSLPHRSYVEVIAKCVSDVDPHMFPREHFYQFGWNGNASVAVRRASGHRLYTQLKELVATYIQKYGVEPIITVVTHSHGGNVALHMAELYKTDTQPLSIDSLILLACPVQTETEAYVVSDCFTTIINAYSPSDWVQAVDVQKVHPFVKGAGWPGFSDAWSSAKKRPLFSGREFAYVDHVLNVSVQWCNAAPQLAKEIFIPKEHRLFVDWVIKPYDLFIAHRGLFHIEMELPPFLAYLPLLMSYIREHDTKNAHMLKINNAIEFYF